MSAAHHKEPRRPSGMTLVELLAVIAIIAVLMGLLFPAVQSVRESARRTQCSAQLRSLGQGCLTHLSLQGRLPYVGKDGCKQLPLYKFPPLPDDNTSPLYGGCTQRSNDNRPRGPEEWNWGFFILPYIEASAVFDRNPVNASNLTVAEKNVREFQIEKTPIPIMYCPSRRGVGLYRDSSNGYAVCDYAGCVGTTAATAGDLSPDPKVNGLMVRRGAGDVRDDSVPDGFSNTILLGERQMNPYRLRGSFPINQIPQDDNGSYAMEGYADREANRDTEKQPAPDNQHPSITGNPGGNSSRFGASHPGSCGIVMGDGSVRWVSHSIEQAVFRRAGSRNGNEVFGVDDLR